MNITEQKKAVKAFVEKWSTKEVSERGGYQIFWIELMQNVHTNFIDIYLPDVRVIIEQKKRGTQLDVKAKQSDGSCLTPFEQAKKYNNELFPDEKAYYIITSNFDEIWVYDMNKERGVYEPVKILLPEIFKYSEFFKNILIKKQTTKIEVEEDISFKAGSIIGKIFKALYKQYEKVYNPLTDEILRDLNKLCVRLVFCFYAEDTDLFPEHNYFQHYMDKVNADKFRKELIDVFETLDTDYPNRNKFIEKTLNDFPYINGGLFDGKIEIPQFDDDLKQIIHEASVLDWSKISPSIFGAIFESTLNPVTRRKKGMHYTTIENIHKVIDPLFLDDLKQEFETIRNNQKNKKTNLENFQNKIAKLKFLDPACGSGNFLTETYICLRRLENEVLKELNNGQMTMETSGYKSRIKVNINQFYGIEINDFAVDVAKAAMWIAENQMLNETLESVSLVDSKALPLNTNDNIVKANALRIDWESVVPKSELNYIIGNPPFVANTGRVSNKESHSKKIISHEQKEDRENLFGKDGGILDYVACWYKKSAKYIKYTNIKCAFVSTDSICQGQQVAPLWKPLFEDDGICIDFAYRSFKWKTEALKSATVFVVIIGFSSGSKTSPLLNGNVCDSRQVVFQKSNVKQEKISLSAKADIPLYERGYFETPTKLIYENNEVTLVSHINAYLMDAPNIFIENRNKPLCNVPKMSSGGKPVEGGFLIFTNEEKKLFVNKEPKAGKFFKKFISGEAFIKGDFQWCLWLKDASPKELNELTLVKERIKSVKLFREKSTKEATRKCAEMPHLFMEIKQPDSDYLVIPLTTSRNRRYVPMGFVSKDIIANNGTSFIPKASIYQFGVLTSKVHMSWMRAVCGYYGPSYRYSNNIVYNNFPWCNPTSEQKVKIEKTAQAILDSRAMYPDSSLYDLYDPVTMPIELRKAHKANDEAVLEAYGLPKNSSETEIVSHLMNLYLELTKDKVKPEKKTKKSREKKANK